MKYDQLVSQLPSERDFDMRAEYSNNCISCGKEIKVIAANDNNQERWTVLYIVCPKCEELVKFKIPVN